MEGRRRPLMEAGRTPCRSFELTGPEVHVWSVRTEASNTVIGQFEQFLAADEKHRADRYRFEHLRNSFVLARGALRILLGCYLDVSPAEISFSYGPKGKPVLAPRASVDFNASHSGAVAVFGFTDNCEIGIDVEQIHPLDEMRNIANRFFCPEETEDLMTLTADQRQRAFFLCWTRKEAYIKAIGDGLSAPLDSFRVTLQPSQSARFIHVGHDTDAAKAWTLHDLQFGPNYAGALAYRDIERPVAVLPLIDAAELLNIR
ncbi:MAG TPA: 4'-phosphopantetheinyl transferase superfamily protein [Bryobacteraceae bacterium]|nr:4'-phosphopantetheinyl transferase superfamily protein [Bryobacteraceae bacterium]